MKETKVAIFTLTKDRLEYTKRTFESLEKYTHIPYDHYVVDNGSKDGTVGYLMGMPGRIVDIVFNHENKGISIASNQALDMIGSGYDYIVKLDNDCEVVSDNWLEPIIEIIHSMRDRAILSPYVDGLVYEFPTGFPRYDYINVNGYRIGLAKHIGGISVVAPAWVYSSYRFPAGEPLHGTQDVRFSAHVQTKLGLRLGYVEDIIVKHMDGTPSQHSKFTEYFELRSYELQAVYGESRLVSKLLRPIRRAGYIISTKRAGISNETIRSSLLKKIKKITGRSD